MPLSDEENRLLAQMEQALAAEDPRFVATLRGRRIERATKVRAGILYQGENLTIDSITSSSIAATIDSDA